MVMTIIAQGCVPQAVSTPLATTGPEHTAIVTTIPSVVSKPTQSPTPGATLTALQVQQLSIVNSILPNYKGPQDVCRWQQLTCDEQGRIIQLNLSAQGLSSLSPKIGNLISLKQLDLSYNPLTSLPPELGHLSDLEELNLEDNRLSNLPPEIGQLSNLRLLRIVNNHLIVLPSEIGLLVNLQWLALYNNQLTTVQIEIRHLLNLRGLNLSHNQLASVPPEIGQLSNQWC